jgi:hypothetical protein
MSDLVGHIIFSIDRRRPSLSRPHTEGRPQLVEYSWTKGSCESDMYCCKAFPKTSEGVDEAPVPGDSILNSFALGENNTRPSKNHFMF